MKQLFEDDPHWKVREILNPKTGKLVNRYFYKMRKCHRIVLETRLAKQLAGYSLIEKDLRNTLFWLNQIKEMIDSVKKTEKKGHQLNIDRNLFNQVKGLFVASVTFYGKCFTQCQGRKVKLDRKNIETKYRSEHDDVIEMRNNFTAHSGALQVEQTEIALILDSKKKSNTWPRIVKELVQPDGYVLDDTENFINLVNHVKSVVEKKMTDITGKLYKDEVYSKGSEYWYDQLKNS